MYIFSEMIVEFQNLRIVTIVTIEFYNLYGPVSLNCKHMIICGKYTIFQQIVYLIDRSLSANDLYFQSRSYSTACIVYSIRYTLVRSDSWARLYTYYMIAFFIWSYSLLYTIVCNQILYFKKSWVWNNQSYARWKNPHTFGIWRWISENWGIGSVAEWSKALDLGSSLSGGVGSNPTAIKF